MNQYANDFTEIVRTYYDDLKKYKPLSRAKEKRLLRLCKKGDIKAKNQILEANLRFVFDIAKKYSGRGLPMSDLISEGNMGLIKAIEKFDYDKDVKFISYAVWWIRQYMSDAIRRSKLVPTVEIESKNEDSSIAIIDKVSSNDDDEYITEYEVLYSNEIDEKRKETTKNQKEFVSNLLVNLNEREKYVLENYYGLNGKKELTLGELGEEMGISSERARQIKITAMRKLRTQVMNIDDIDELF